MGKKIKGKKRHILFDKLGLLPHAFVDRADIQDRDAGIFLLAALFGMYPFLKTLFADGGYQGPEFKIALAEILPYLKAEIVKRSDHVNGITSIARRSRSYASPQFASCSESFAIQFHVFGQTLSDG